MVSYVSLLSAVFLSAAYWVAGGYHYTADQLRLDGCRTPQPQKLPSSMGTIVSLLRWPQWHAGLLNHPDRALANFITTGIREGFRIGYDTMLQDRRGAAKNMPSALERREVVSVHLAKECTEGRVLGPFEEH